MIDLEIASLLEDAGYRFAPQIIRYRVVEGAATADETEHSSDFVADELGIPLDDLLRWEDEQLAGEGLVRPAPDADPESPTQAVE
jgi:hypothetical protein